LFRLQVKGFNIQERIFNRDDQLVPFDHLGTLLARHKVNIASMSLTRDTVGGQALTVLNLDSVPPGEVMDEIQKDPDISNVKVVEL